MTLYPSGAVVGLGLLEKDVNEDVVSWWFPSYDQSLDLVIRSRSGLVDQSQATGSVVVSPPLSPSSSTSQSSFFSSSSSPSSPSFRCSRYGLTVGGAGVWHYSLTFRVESSAAVLSKVRVAAIILLANHYDVVKARTFLNSLTKPYLESGSPVSLLQVYLSTVTRARVLDTAEEVSERQSGAIAPLRGLLRTLGVESILVWVAVLCKKRVLVYGGDVDGVQEAVRSAGLLGSWHRPSMDFLRPLTTLREEELADLRAAGSYVAGTVDPQASVRRDLYDIAVDLSTGSVVVNEASRADFVLSKYHKGAADELMAAAEMSGELEAIEAVHAVTSSLLSTIRGLQVDTPQGKAITLQGLKQHKLPANMDHFVVNVAKAEGWFLVE